MKRLLTLSLILISAISYAFDINPKFGSVSMDELTMDSYAKDTSAVAVYLYSSESTEKAIELTGFTSYYTVRRRIKILKDSGREFADFSIGWDKGEKESVKGIKVTTFNLVDGKIKSTKMSRNYIFEQNVAGDYYTTRFSAQDVVVGSVIEMEYTLESPVYWDIPDVHLQKSIPIIKGEAKVIYPEYFHFQKYERGYNKAEYTQTLDTKVYGQLTYRQIIDKYTVADMPAIKTEDHCWCPGFYADAVVYDLSDINFPGVLSKSFNKHWEEIDRAFMGTNMVSAIMRKRPFLKDELDALASTMEGMSFEDVIIATRNLVASKVLWNGEHSFAVDVNDAIKKGVGNDSEINCITGAALNYLGFNVSPTLLLQRKHGLLVSFHISTSSFSKMVLQVLSENGKVWYLDASDPFGALNCLPYNCLVEEARAIHRDGSGEWVNLTNLVRSMEYDLVEGTVSEDGTFTYKASLDLTNHTARDFKSLFAKEKDEEKTAEILETILGSEIEQLSFNGLNDWTSTMNCTVEATKNFDTSEGIIYINPFIRRFQDTGAFEAADRVLPVEFDYPESVTYNITIRIPSGYEIAELPNSISAAMRSIGSIVRTSYAKIDEQTIRVAYQYKLGNLICMTTEYNELREYWMVLSNIYKDRIVIRKK